MNTKKNARWQAGEKLPSLEIFARPRSLIKCGIVSAALWRLITFKAAERLIRVLRLRGA
jgi:hypothetical protein